MAKKGVATSAAAKAAVKDVSINDVPALVVTPERPVNVLVNFTEVEQFLDILFEKYTGMEFTTANLDEVRKTKEAMRALRVRADKFAKDVKADYFNNPKKLFETGMAPVLSKIASIEDKCDAVLAEEDEKRIEGINKAIEAHIASLVEEFALEEDFRGFERSAKFYNKTQEEKNTISALTEQAVLLSRSQKSFKAGVSLIEGACRGDKRLNVAMYLRDLKDGEDVAVILSSIQEEISRLSGIDAPVEPEPVEPEPVEPEPVEPEPVDDVLEGLDFNSDLPERVKVLKVELTYPVDIGDTLTELFSRLWQLGVKSKVLPGTTGGV